MAITATIEPGPATAAARAGKTRTPVPRTAAVYSAIAWARPTVPSATTAGVRPDGDIPDDDIPQLEAMGGAKIFTPGTPTQAIVDWVEDHIKKDE